MARWASSILNKKKIKDKKENEQEKNNLPCVEAKPPPPWTWVLSFLLVVSPLSLSLGGIFEPFEKKKACLTVVFYHILCPGFEEHAGLVSPFFLLLLRLHDAFTGKKLIIFSPNMQNVLKISLVELSLVKTLMLMLDANLMMLMPMLLMMMVLFSVPTLDVSPPLCRSRYVVKGPCFCQKKRNSTRAKQTQAKERIKERRKGENKEIVDTPLTMKWHPSHFIPGASHPRDSKVVILLAPIHLLDPRIFPRQRLMLNLFHNLQFRQHIVNQHARSVQHLL